MLRSFLNLFRGDSFLRQNFQQDSLFFGRGSKLIPYSRLGQYHHLLQKNYHLFNFTYNPELMERCDFYLDNHTVIRNIFILEQKYLLIGDMYAGVGAWIAKDAPVGFQFDLDTDVFKKYDLAVSRVKKIVRTPQKKQTKKKSLVINVPEYTRINYVTYQEAYDKLPDSISDIEILR